MKVLLGFLIMFFGVALPSYAEEYGGRHSQLQAQIQKQVQAQVQAQAQTSVGTVTVTGDEYPEERRLYKGSQALAVPQGNDGLGLMTPWGGTHDLPWQSDGEVSGVVPDGAGD